MTVSDARATSAQRFLQRLQQSELDTGDPISGELLGENSGGRVHPASVAVTSGEKSSLGRLDGRGNVTAQHSASALDQALHSRVE